MRGLVSKWVWCRVLWEMKCETFVPKELINYSNYHREEDSEAEVSNGSLSSERI